MSLKVDAVVVVEKCQCRGCVGPNCASYLLRGHPQECGHTVSTHWYWQELKVCGACYNLNVKPDGDFYAPKVPIVTIHGSAASACAPPPGLTEEPKLSLQMDMAEAVEVIKQLRQINERLDVLGTRITRIERFFEKVQIVDKENDGNMSDDGCSSLTSWQKAEQRSQ